MAEFVTTPGTVCANQYVVKRGDSFYLISHRLGIPLRALLEANPSINPARLMVGDILCIPMEEPNHTPQNVAMAPAPAPLTPAPAPITIAPAPAVPQVSVKIESAPAEQPIAQAVPNAIVTPQAVPPVTMAAPPCPESVRVTVQAGETISDIQLAHDINLHTLEIANPQQDLENLTTGQVLCVPAISLACAMPDTYCMQEGESLESLAVRFKLPIARLLRANPCLAPGDFAAGVSVVVPK